MLLAGPGTGKTHTLALRTKWLVEKNHATPDQITIITFTGEAARNMGVRISDPERKDVYMQPQDRPKQIRTMHSLGQQILTANCRKAGLRKGFSVISSDTLRKLLLEDAAQLAGFPRSDGLEISKRRTEGITTPVDDPKSGIEAKYREMMRACNTVDYDEQIMLACKLLRENGDIRQEWAAKSKHLLVDEYQDINAAHFDLIRLLSEGQTEGLYVVGDDDQSIYGWRGGSPEFLRRFKGDFGQKSKVESLPICYRCTTHVLDGAAGLVSRFNPDRMPKPVPKSKRPDGAKIFCYDVPSQQKEAEIIAAKASEIMPSHDVLILLPSQNFAPPIQAALRRRRISYESSGATDIPGFRLVNTLADWLDEQDHSFALRLCIQAMLNSGIGGVPSLRVRDAAKKAARDVALGNVSALWDRVVREGLSFRASLEQGAQKEKLLKTIWDALQTICHAREKSIDEFLTAVVSSLRPWSSSDSFLDQVRGLIEESTGRGRNSSSGVARILSLQSAKGREADYVFVVGLDEDILPKGDAKNDDVTETSRLVYVSMTRAKEELHLFHARKREGKISYLLPKNKDGQLSTLKPSRFFAAIPDANKECIFVQSDEAKRQALRRKVAAASSAETAANNREGSSVR